MIEDPRNYTQIRAEHPFPWDSRVIPGLIRNGMAEVKVVDAAGKEVPLFTILRLAEIITTAKTPEPATPT